MRARAHVHKWRPYSTYSTARRPLYAASPFPSLLLRKAPSLWWAVLFPLEGWSVLHCSDEDSGCDEHGWNVDMHSVTPKALTLCYHMLGQSSASTTFVTGTKTLALKEATVPSHHPLLLQLSWNTLCVYGAHASLALEVIVLLSCTWPRKCFVEWNYLFVCGKRVYTLTLCRRLRLRWAVLLCTLVSLCSDCL